MQASDEHATPACQTARRRSARRHGRRRRQRRSPPPPLGNSDALRRAAAAGGAVVAIEAEEGRRGPVRLVWAAQRAVRAAARGGHGGRVRGVPGGAPRGGRGGAPALRAPLPLVLRRALGPGRLAVPRLPRPRPCLPRHRRPQLTDAFVILLDRRLLPCHPGHDARAWRARVWNWDACLCRVKERPPCTARLGGWSRLHFDLCCRRA
jgi:hypothetical protein